MANERPTPEDLFAKSVGVAVAVGALAVGVAAAVLNQERARQMRAEVQGQIDELGKRIDDLSSRAARLLEEKRPDIESTLAKSRQAVIDGLERAKGIVEQGAERAQDYVHKASHQAAGSAENVEKAWDDTAETVGTAVEDVADDARNAADDFGMGGETRNLHTNGSTDGPH